MVRRVVGLALIGVLAIGASGVAMSLDEALALFQNDNIAVAYSNEGWYVLLEVIGALRAELGVTDALDETKEDPVKDFAVDASLKDVVNKLSQAYYTLANVFVDPADNESIYLKGKHWGLKSLRMNPDFVALEKRSFVEAAKAETDVPALYWATANWLRVAQKDPMGALLGGVPAKTQAMSERCLELDPLYVVGGSYRSLGAYWSGLPIGRKLDKTLDYLCHVVTEPACEACGDCQPAIAGADEYFENRTFIAEFYYMEKNMWDEAARVLEAVLAEPIGDKYPLMNAYAQEHARDLLAFVQSKR